MALRSATKFLTVPSSVAVKANISRERSQSANDLEPSCKVAGLPIRRGIGNMFLRYGEQAR